MSSRKDCKQGPNFCSRRGGHLVRERLARVLLLLAGLGEDGKREAVIAKISQESLAEMIGTTRSRASFFMNKFRKLGFVAYHRGALSVYSSLLNVLLND